MYVDHYSSLIKTGTSQTHHVFIAVNIFEKKHKEMVFLNIAIMPTIIVDVIKEEALLWIFVGGRI
jgi:hypothetical protein